jgi:hypothetical protein
MTGRLHGCATFLSFGLYILIAGCATQLGASFPQPSPGFQPKAEYDISQEQLLNVAVKTLDANRMPAATINRAEGRITTEYISGPDQQWAYGFRGGIGTRYRYFLTMDKAEL